jgi:sortase (surface protein transpeptidase)
MVHRLLKAITTGVGRQGLLLVLALAAAAGGVIAIIIGVAHQQSAPQPSASAAGQISSTHRPKTTPAEGPRTPAATSGPSSTGPTQPAGSSAKTPLPPSVPVSIGIPAIGVQSAVISIGKAADGTLAVPQPGPNLNKAAWYEDSVTPGQDGPAVIEGHIDSVYGPSVFFKLGALRPGDQITVTRRDDSVVRFQVNAVRSYATHGDFPTEIVYGGDLGQPTLRLITCSNFDDSTGHYVGNTVVYAHLTAVHHTKPATRQ